MFLVDLGVHNVALMLQLPFRLTVLPSGEGNLASARLEAVDKNSTKPRLSVHFGAVHW